jgi:hypothetical protein
MKIIPSFDLPAFDPGLHHHLESVKAALEEVELV